QLLVRQLVVGANVEHVHVALAARSGITGPGTRADHVEILVVGREHEPVWIGKLFLGEHEIDSPARISPIQAGRHLALQISDLRRLAEARLPPTRAIAGTAGCVWDALVELSAVWRIREPITPVGMRYDIVRRVEPLAIVRVCNNRHRTVVLVAN